MADIFKTAEDMELDKLRKLKDTYQWAADQYLEKSQGRGHAFDASEFKSKTMQTALKNQNVAKRGYKSGGMVQKTGMAKVHKGEAILTKKEAGHFMKEHIKKMRGAGKVRKSMEEFKAGELHSGSKSGPVVKSRKQAIAIGLSEERKAQQGKY